MSSVAQVPALYDSVVTHSRRAPLTNRFRYRTAYWLVDLDRLPQPAGPLEFLARVRARDHVDVRALLRDSGVAAERVLMLTMARSLGYVFNPISVFWAYDRAGDCTAVVAEVHNTYGGRHAYLLRPDRDGYAEADKALYVSPFYPVDGRYQFNVSEPGESMSLRVTLRRDGDEPFVASLHGRRQAVTTANLLRATFRYPSGRTAALIRWQGLRLWWRGLRVQPAMSTDLLDAAAGRSLPIDLGRWPALAPPKPAPGRAAVARALMARIADRTGIHFRLADGRTFGPVNGPALDIADPSAFFTRLGRDGKIGFGEAYMAGEWDSPDLVALLEALARRLGTLVPPPLQRLRRFHDARPPTAEDNDQAGARRNIARHYDLSNDLFAAFLDQTMTYSSALFTDDREPLEAAQLRKIDRLLDATGVGARSRLLEIGTGWGELALRAAGRGAHVTTVTLSVEQAALARRRVAAAGLSDLVDVRVEDYRDVIGRYDAVVSIEMIEAVGIRWWPAYFKAIDQRLAVGGRVGLQAILMSHDRLLATQGSWTWIHKYIFPGGILPSEQAIRETLGAHTSLMLSDRFTFGDSYAITLQRWRERFDDRAELVDHLGFDRTFRRMWNFYLAYSEAGFRSGYLDVAQLVLRRPGEA